MKIVIALLIIGLLIFVHEFGHFVVAKTCGVLVKEFSIGMGPRILKYKRKDTLYSIKLLPFGGACLMAGMDGDDDIGDRSYLSKSVWKRMAIIVAGPLFNLILAFLFSVIFISKVGYDPCIIGRVSDNSPAAEAGLMPGDQIIKVNNKKVTFYEDFYLYEYAHEGETLNITYLRDNEKYTTSIVPVYVDKNVYQMGVSIESSKTSVPVKIVDVTKDSPAQNAGIEAGDIVEAINSEKVNDYNDLLSLMEKYGEEEITVTVNRNGTLKDFKLVATKIHQQYYNKGFDLANVWVKVNPIKTIGYSFKYTGYWAKSVFTGFKMLINKKASFNDFSGPVGIVNLVGTVVEETKSDGLLTVIMNLLNFCIMISANLAVMNILPIPALDGGKFLFLVIEAVRGKPVPREKEGMVHLIGVILLFIFTLAVLFNDIMKLF